MVFGVILMLNLMGNFIVVFIVFVQGGIDIEKGFFCIFQEVGYCVFDVFYYFFIFVFMLVEREFFGFKVVFYYSFFVCFGIYDFLLYFFIVDDGVVVDDFWFVFKEIGIKGFLYCKFILIFVGLLKLGNIIDYNVDEDVLDDICEDVGGFFGLEFEILVKQCIIDDCFIFIGGFYEVLVDWVIKKVNEIIVV